MTTTQISVNGKMVIIKPTVSRFMKTASILSQGIFRDLEKIGIEKSYVDLPIPRNSLSREEPTAQISWRANKEEFYYSCNTQERFVDNLGVIARVIHQETYAIRNGLKSFGMVMNQFRLGFDEKNQKEKVISPREILGIPDYINDIDYITFKYKDKAKELHPDMQTGDATKFKALNEAYEQLKKELEKK